MLADLVYERCEWPPTTKLLDFGCGRHGNIATALCQHTSHTVAVDASADAVRAFNEQCRQQGLRAAEVQALAIDAFVAEPRFEGYFDIAAASLVFHHIDAADRAATLAMLRQRLRPGGVLVLVDVLKPDANAKINGFTEPELEALLRRAAFRDVSTQLGPRITLHSQKRTRIVVARAQN